MARAIFIKLVLVSLLNSCVKDGIEITTDFDNVKLTESPNPLSPYYVKGTVRGMRFSYSTNDVFYAKTTFPSFSDTLIQRAPYVFFSIGEFGQYMPIWFYLEAGIWFKDFIKNSMKANTKFTLTPPKTTSSQFDFFFFAKYHDPGFSYELTRGFNCCFYGKKSGEVVISNVQNFAGYTNVTFQITGPLYSTDNEGAVLFFGDASIEMCIRINQ